MGVYVFRSLHAPYIKVGHYQGTNAFSRIAHRGFSSCLCPQEIQHRVSMEDMELLAWFPRQTKKTERDIKKKWKQDRIYGKSEWLPAHKLGEVLEYLQQWETNQAHDCDPFEAVLTHRRL